MPQADTNKSGSKTKIIIAMLIAGFVMVGGLLYWHAGNDEEDDEPASAIQSFAANVSKEEIIDAQKIADVAAIPGKAISGKVMQRPDYVTEIEWQVFQNVTKNQPDREKKLTDLINKMLFIKKKTAWLASGENTAERRQLARQLLEMIPGQLEIEAIDPATAEELEDKLDADLR